MSPDLCYKCESNYYLNEKKRCISNCEKPYINNSIKRICEYKLNYHSLEKAYYNKKMNLIS